jgi:hypothetical protein
VDGTSSGSCPMVVGFCMNDVESLGSATKELVNKCKLLYKLYSGINK